VGVEQFVVVGACRLWQEPADAVGDGSGNDVSIGHQPSCGHRGVGDVVQEGVAGGHGIGQADGGGGIALHEEVVGRTGQAVDALHDHLREAVGPADEHAVGVGGQQRHVEQVGVG
jgi:hypothetical protein